MAEEKKVTQAMVDKLLNTPIDESRYIPGRYFTDEEKKSLTEDDKK